jgi:DNA-binding PadR family transcriptional regulator
MLKPLPLHILIALTDGERHGSAIMQAIREQSDGQVPVQTASFYRHLASLLEEGLVAESAARREKVDPRRGAYYRITPRGRQVLEAERQRLTGLIAQINRARLTPRRAGS